MEKENRLKILQLHFYLVFKGLFFISLLSNTPILAQNICFNEVMTSNETDIMDEDLDQEDWIELYNHGTTPISLINYGLSDDIALPYKWLFPEVILAPKEYILVWASGKNRISLDQPLHSNFKIKSSGETISLTRPDGILVDQINPTSIPTNLSYGRSPDGLNNWSFFKEPTPNAENNTEAYNEILSPVIFSESEGFYKNSFNLELTHPDSSVIIIYTLDGSEPGFSTLDSDFIHRKSYIYNESIDIRSRIGEPNIFSTIPTAEITFGWLLPWKTPSGEVYKTNVVRAKAFKPKAVSSVIKTATYFVDQNADSLYSTMPIISIVADYRDLFDPETGLYVPGNDVQDMFDQNFFKGWKRPAHMEFFEIHRSSGFKGTYEISMQGSSSLASPQKGLHVIAKSSLGSNKIQYPIFNTVDGPAAKIDEYKRFILRGWGSALSTKIYPFFSDAYNQTLAEGNGIEIQSYRPCIVFINGEYWGIHELREANKNSWYYQSHFGIDRDNPGYDLIGERDITEADEGDLVHWNSIMDYINSNDMSNHSSFEVVEANIDVQNLIEYVVHSTYLGKRDWPPQNEAKWRPRTNDGLWRWTQFDMDHGLSTWGGDFDMIAGVMVEQPHDLFVKLMANQKFQHDFFNTYADWMNSIFSTQREISHFNKMKDELDPYIEEYLNRWPLGINWNSITDDAIIRINNRLDYRRRCLTDYFSLSTIEATLNSDTAQGYIHINTIDIKSGTPGISSNPYTWTGVYFQNIPIALKAIPKPGYKFSHWSGASTSTVAEILLTPTENFTIQANFGSVWNALPSVDPNPILSIYPNPTKDVINISYSCKTLYTIEIVSMNGKQMLMANIHNPEYQIDLSCFDEGLYFITIRSKDFVTTKKIIKL